MLSLLYFNVGLISVCRFWHYYFDNVKKSSVGKLVK